MDFWANPIMRLRPEKMARARSWWVVSVPPRSLEFISRRRRGGTEKLRQGVDIDWKPARQHQLHHLGPVQIPFWNSRVNRESTQALLDSVPQASPVKWGSDPAFCLLCTGEVGVGVEAPQDESIDGKATAFLQTRTKQLHLISWGNRSAAKFSNRQMVEVKGLVKPGGTWERLLQGQCWKGERLQVRVPGVS